MLSKYLAFSSTLTLGGLFISFITASPSCQSTFTENNFFALRTLYYSAQGINWNWKNESYGNKWNVLGEFQDACCQRWQGINCSFPFGLTYLNLSAYNLSGNLTNNFFLNATNIISFDLSENYLVGKRST